MARILVIDDETELLQVISIVLERRGGHETVVSAKAREGLALALADPPDLAIIDVMMPGMTGYEICRQLRANPATASIPIIILTARAQIVDREAALEAGADVYMTKPAEMTDLLDQVNELLAKRAVGEPSALAGTVVLMSLRGGVGVTTLAVNLAATLVRGGDSSVCLVDLCPSSGHVALQLGLRPEPNLADLMRAYEVLTPGAEAVEEYLLQHASGLRVLASPLFPIVGPGAPRAVVEATLGSLRQRFAVVVVDVPSVLAEATMVAVEAASAVALVVTAEAPSIQATIGTLRVLNQWSNKCHLILNQVTPGPQPAPAAIERTLRRSFAGVVPFDPAQARALPQGVPLAFSSPDSPLAQSVQEWAHKL
ncbi:MAG: hypothetical protein DRI48_08860, partial [Chloroflexi bacterium]